MILHGDCLELMAEMEPNGVDAIVTDPPYELSFMGKKWDGTGIAFDPATWEACLRVLKPGGHLVAFSGTRTSHRMICAIEDAGFEIRDSLVWLYGSGFPKSLDVSKQIDKMAGAQRDVIGQYAHPDAKPRNWTGHTTKRNGIYSDIKTGDELNSRDITAPATPEAEQWQGWGTALKPGHEPICLARKPLAGTVASTVLAYGTGALNIDACRIGTTVETWPKSRNYASGNMREPGITKPGATESTGESPAGRWPANVILDETAASLLDAMSGERKSGWRYSDRASNTTKRSIGAFKEEYTGAHYGDTGGASRFFYCAKSSRSERNAGLDGMPERDSRRHGDTGPSDNAKPNGQAALRETNHHPTVKPLSLMRWLVRLVCPPGGTVLDPFAGSGSTGCAAALEGFDFIGIEQDAEYVEIARARIAHWTPKAAPQLALALEAIAGA